MNIWRRTKMKALEAEAESAAADMAKLLKRRAKASGAGYVWGQYLDDERRSEQWGVYATSAAVQTLALYHRYSMPQTLSTADAYVSGGVVNLPSDLDNLPPALEPKRERHNFENVVRLAYAAQALEPNHELVPPDDTPPPLVSQILTQAVGNGWSSRITGEASLYERVFPTAYVLLALGRYSSARSATVYTDSRLALARQIMTQMELATPPNMALFGLALLLPADVDQTRPQDVTDALDLCEQRVLDWAHARRHFSLDRPVFYGFSLGPRNDYNFLQPELLAAVFLLRRRNPARGRRFVLRTMRALLTNVSRNGGLVTHENNVQLTVTQMWAMRFLIEFLSIRKPSTDPHRLRTELDVPRLLPCWDPRHLVNSGVGRVGAALALVVGGLGIFLVTSVTVGGALVAFVAAVLFLLAGMFVPPYRPRG